MATVIQKGKGRFEIRVAVSGRKRSYYVSKTTRRKAVAIGDYLDDLAYHQKLGGNPEAHTMKWIESIDAKSRKKLSEWGLIRHVVTGWSDHDPTLKQWIVRFLEIRKRCKSSTLEQITISMNNLLAFFGDDKPIKSFHSGDAEDFRIWLETEAKNVPEGKPKAGLGSNTAARRIGRAKELFNAAIKRKIIDINPFENEKSIVKGGELFEVPAHWTERIIQAAPCEDWRIIIALARYGGLRRHECLMQRWEDVDLPKRRMIVRSNKTPPMRFCPIFSELLPHLLRAKEMAPEGAVFLQTRYEVNANPGTTLKKLIERADLPPWPKGFQNMRATRISELRSFGIPAKTVSLWLGNSVAVADEHYHMVMGHDWEKVTGFVPEKVPPKRPPSVPVTDAHPENPCASVARECASSIENDRENAERRQECAPVRDFEATPQGLEP